MNCPRCRGPMTTETDLSDNSVFDLCPRCYYAKYSSPDYGFDLIQDDWREQVDGWLAIS